MIFGHKKLSESVVMREFEKVAISKNMVKISEPTITKEASASASYQPSNNLIDDMLKLAIGLRGRGFEKDASSLEEKVLNYKLAETHLYRAIDEDAEDMLEFAHPKKNKIQFDAQNGDGEVEDTLSQHKKIIDIVNKQSKKVAFEVLAETADILGLKKKAAADKIDQLISRINYFKSHVSQLLNSQKSHYYVTRSSILSGAEDALFIGNEKLGVGYPLIEGNATYAKNNFAKEFLNYFRESNNLDDAKVWSSFLNKDSSFNEVVTDEGINHTNKNLDEDYNHLFQKLNSLPIIKKQENNSVNVDNVNKFITMVNELIPNNEHINFLYDGLTFNNYNGIKNKVIEFIGNMSEAAKELLSVKSPINTNNDNEWNAGWANLIAGRFESVADKDSDPAYFKQVASIIRSFSTKPYVELYPALVAFDSDLDKATDFHKLDLIGQEWQKHYKIANLNNGIVKKAKTVPEDNEPATKPATYQQAVRPTQHTQSVKSNFSQTYPEEFRAVADMQIALGTLADNLSKLPLTLTPEQIKSYKNVLLGTGYGEKGEFADRVDGEWGSKTQKALDAANQLFKALKVNEVTSTAQRINGKANIDQKEIAKLALDNEAQINQILADKAGVELKDKDKNKSNSNKSHHNGFLDNLPENSDLLQINPPLEEDETGVGLTVNDLSSFGNLSNFIRRNFKNIKFTNGGINYNTWEIILNWFYKRANKQAKQLANSAGQEDLKKLKANYAVLAQNLYDNLYKFQSGGDASKILSPKELDGSESSSSNQTTGPTQNANLVNKTNTNADGTEVEAGNTVSGPEQPPYKYLLNIDDLKRSKYGNSMENYDAYRQYLSVPFLNVDKFAYSPSNIIGEYIKALTPNVILNFNGIADSSAIVPGQKYRWIDLINSTDPAAITMKVKAGDVALLTVVNGLSRDLSAVATQYINNSPSDKYSQIMANTWSKWSANLTTAYSRINSDFAERGQISKPKVIF